MLYVNIKGVVHPKIIIESSFIPSHVAPNLYDFILWNINVDVFVTNCCPHSSKYCLFCSEEERKS